MFHNYETKLKLKNQVKQTFAKVGDIIRRKVSIGSKMDSQEGLDQQEIYEETFQGQQLRIMTIKTVSFHAVTCGIWEEFLKIIVKNQKIKLKK